MRERTDRLRFGRQSRLPEIGEQGQARLGEAKVALGSEGFARTIEEKYVRGFGASIDAGARVHAIDAEILGLESPAAREVGEGALRALVALRSILESSRGESSREERG